MRLPDTYTLSNTVIANLGVFVFLTCQKGSNAQAQDQADKDPNSLPMIRSKLRLADAEHDHAEALSVLLAHLPEGR